MRHYQIMGQCFVCYQSCYVRDKQVSKVVVCKSLIIYAFLRQCVIIEDTGQLCPKVVKFAALQYLNESARFYLLNGKLYYFSHVHYTNWVEMWSQLQVLSLVILNKKLMWATARDSLCVLLFTTCFCSQMNCNIQSHTKLVWNNVKILDKYLFESPTGSTLPFVDMSCFLEIIYLASIL